MCVCAYIYIHIYIHSCILNTQYIFIYVRLCVCVCARARVWVCVYMDQGMCMYTFPLRMCMYIKYTLNIKYTLYIYIYYIVNQGMCMYMLPQNKWVGCISVSIWVCIFDFTHVISTTLHTHTQVIVDNGKHEVRGRKVDVKSAVKREEMTPAVHI